MIGPQKLLKKYEIHPAKRRGQNFLTSLNTVHTIIEKASFDPGDLVIEIGTGLGLLSLPLAEKVESVISFEIDARLIAVVEKEYEIPVNLKIVHQDVLTVDFVKLEKEAGQSLRIIGNLPYYISGPILFKLWEARAVIQSAALMLQKEVADRLLSPPGRKKYGILTVLFNYCAEVKELLSVPSTQFYPRPEVDSKVIGIYFREPRIKAQDEDLYKMAIKTAFQKRRKTLKNALSNTELFSAMQVGNALQAAGIDGQRRPETLTSDEFVQLSNALSVTVSHKKESP